MLFASGHTHGSVTMILLNNNERTNDEHFEGSLE
jgi:hypothetical protein